MRVNLTEETVTALETALGERISKNADQIIRKVAGIAQNFDKKSGIEMNVCNTTLEEMKKEDA